ncbi:MAG: flagellar basal body L-ring protein [SAR86 cluster bacterium]|uniref:Flagellar L-ring protein n=1 Tax=SAR86 cluster bacterium TaxID=2030880 RepID=A0A2A4XHT8_9GAMM|nr:MAG: flagellar basal body L-ring protein [SAR86 cluster bacterium]
MSLKIKKYLTVLILLTGVVSCTTPQSNQPLEGEQEPSYLRLQSAGELPSGSLYQASSAMGLYEDIKAKRIGDILTVVLVEQTSGQNSADNSVNQSTEMNVRTPTFGGSSRANMQIDLGSENSFSGQSGSSQSNSLSGAITVTVHTVLPNGNLVVEGEKWIRINQANEFVRLKGVVRQVDIDTNNTLLSTQVADARISYGGTGTSGNSPGWAAKVLFSSIWPF